MGDPGGLPSMGSHRVGHDWSDLEAAAALLSCLTMFLTFSLHFLGQYLCLPVPTHWEVLGAGGEGDDRG